MWIQGQVTIPSSSDTYELIFEGMIGEANQGNVALDDIKLVQGGTCDFFASTTTSTTSLRPSLEIMFKCNFETDFCDWNRDTISDLWWTRRNGENAYFGLAPYFDHTLENSVGMYAFVDSSSNNGQQGIARLRSPQLSWSGKSCLEFWYQISGSATLTLTLRNTETRADLWKRFGNEVDSWKHTFVQISENNSRRWLDFEGN